MDITLPLNLLGPKVTETPDKGLVDIDKLKPIQDQIESGLPDSQERRDRARKNDAFYRMRGVVYIEKRESETDTDFARRPKHVSYLVKKAIDTLGRRLYQPAPVRKLVLPDGSVADTESSDGSTIDPETSGINAGLAPDGTPYVDSYPPLGPADVDLVSDWLEKTYKAAKANAILDSANKRAVLNDAAAIQVAATGDPKKPIRLWVYSAHEFEVFCDPEDPTQPWAVVTIAVTQASVGKMKRVYTLYTDTHEYTYETKPFSSLESQAGGTRAIFQRSRKHGYGILPFAFFHNETPVEQFWCGGIGTALTETESNINDRLSDLDDLVQKFVCPDYFGRNLDVNFRYSKRPGRIQLLKPPASVSAGEAVMGPPEVFHVQPQLNIEEIWLGVSKTATQIFANLDVPITSSWDNTQSPTSGLQVIAQDAPYMEYLMHRQLPTKSTESELAKVVLTVAGNHYQSPILLAAAEQTEIDLEFPAPVTLVPTPERNQDIQWKIEWGLMSQIEAIMQQRGVTRDQAEKIAAQVAQDRALIESLQQGNTPPTAMPPTGGDPNATDGQTPPDATAGTSGGPGDQGGQDATGGNTDQPSKPGADSATNNGTPSGSN